jgi:hypothetical protein
MEVWFHGLQVTGHAAGIPETPRRPGLMAVQTIAFPENRHNSAGNLDVRRQSFKFRLKSDQKSPDSPNSPPPDLISTSCGHAVRLFS